jgi:uncharacterized RDD family membrane protein YckC
MNINILDESTYQARLVEASKSKRFLNYIIDLIINYIFLFLIISMIGFFVGFDRIDNADDIGSRILATIFLGLLWSLQELIFKGRSIGKFITKTKAVQKDGIEITSKQAFQRGFSRIVPFEVFSGFGQPWHDTWTDTMVIDLEQSHLE